MLTDYGSWTIIRPMSEQDHPTEEGEIVPIDPKFSNLITVGREMSLAREERGLIGFPPGSKSSDKPQDLADILRPQEAE